MAKSQTPYPLVMLPVALVVLIIGAITFSGLASIRYLFPQTQRSYSNRKP